MRGEQSLADVAAESGFADQAHPTRAFRAAFGLTPARYRARRAGGGRGHAPAEPAPRRSGPPVSSRPRVYWASQTFMNVLLS
jgi:AraC-like DNA-binding protein